MSCSIPSLSSMVCGKDLYFGIACGAELNMNKKHNKFNWTFEYSVRNMYNCQLIIYFNI